MPGPVDICALCLQRRELRISHIIPKALYRLYRGDGKEFRNPNPVLLGYKYRRQTSKQTTDYLLCAECERRFDQNGESWVMFHCYRGRRVFRLRSLILQTQSIATGPDLAVYSASAISNIHIEKLAYFAASVIWRASLRNLDFGGAKYEAIKLGPYQEQLRSYLLGQGEFPQNALLHVVLSHLEFPLLAGNHPDSIHVDEGRCHRFHIPGISFLLTFGKHIPANSRLSCLVHGPLHPIFIGKAGDAFVQTALLSLIGQIRMPLPDDNVIEGYECALSKTE